MDVSKFLRVLVAGGAALTSGCSNEVTGGGSGGGATSNDASATSGPSASSASATTSGTSGSAGGQAGSGQGGAGGAGAAGQGGGTSDCECTDGHPIHCGPPPVMPGVCCMWMFGADVPCCDKL